MAEQQFWTVQTEGSMLTVRTAGTSVTSVLKEATVRQYGNVIFMEFTDEPGGMEPVQVLVNLAHISTIEPERRTEKVVPPE